MQIGIAVPQSWGEPAASMAELRRFAMLAESAGLSSLWVQEQLVGTDPSFEPLATLAYLAGVTDRIRLAAAGVVAPLRPTLSLAKMLTTIDQFSLGRLVVGLVAGEARDSYAAGTVAWSDRGALMEHTITVLHSLWRGEPAVVHSRFGRYDGLVITPPPVQPGGPPIWVGAGTPAGLDRVARLADGWIGAGGSSMSQWRQGLSTLRERCQAHGRAVPPVGKKLYLWMDQDSQRALNRLSHWFSAHWKVADGEELARRVGVWGPPGQIADRLGELAEAGATVAVLNPVGDELRQLDLLCEQVLPALDHAVA